MTAWRRRGIQVLVVAGLGAGVLWGLATVKATTRQGVNFQVSTRQVPLSVKAIDFLHRHAHYRLLAEEITRGLRADQERVLAVFEWTRQHIRHTPTGWPVVDDHVLDIIIRGHGLDDQMADVFTTLTAYAGVPAFWQQGLVVLSFVQVDGRWAMFDVGNGLVFADAQGRLIEAEALLADRSLVDRVAGSLAPGGREYWWYVDRLRPFQIPTVRRAQLQMPWPRLWYEARRAIGWGGATR
jgi:hypothetical protein